ncbi:hypothetical protein GCM10010210_43940 [Pseudonocardia hydrocarbonoxydans]|uniref:Uncharacterized protein n=1 Tax=Pseudonocardia hydrocarbonoxydans TaxID=76726 RepID=A0A4Y3WK56_9PSEU|nr:hypothetical protein PHY01_14470 [Pseudonocardia hydrocarbonoxydans]
MRAGGLTGTAAAPAEFVRAPVAAAVGPGWSVPARAGTAGRASAVVVAFTGRAAACTRRVDGRGARRGVPPRCLGAGAGPFTSSPTPGIVAHHGGPGSIASPSSG